MAMDCDPDAGNRASSLGDDFGERFKFVDDRFQNFDQYAKAMEFDGVLA